MKETAAAIQPGAAALFALVRKVTADKVLEGLKGEGGTVLKTSLDHTEEAAPQPALAGVQELYLLRSPELYALSAWPSCAVPSIETIRVASGLAGLNATFVFPRVCSGRGAAAQIEPDAPGAKGSPHSGSAGRGDRSAGWTGG
jgi:hypothetical protein